MALDPQFKRAANISSTEILHTNFIGLFPFVVTYNPSLPRISNVLCNHFNVLFSSRRCREILKHPPFVAYRPTSNLRDILV